MRGLYAIVDVATLAARSIEPIAFAEALLLAGPAALQLREKGGSPREALTLLRELSPMCRRAAVPLVVNDHPDWAILAGCDMVHVGQTDMPIDRVRRLAPGMRVGVSTHTIAELAAALGSRPEYVAFGPVFETVTKANPEPVVGLSGLKQAYDLAAAAAIPLVAIGGVTLDRARSLVGSTDCVAAIADLLPPLSLPTGQQGTRPSDVLQWVVDRARAFGALFSSPVARGSRR